jgi:hypothetical protein
MTNKKVEKRLKELKEWDGIPEKTIKEYIDYLGYAVEEGYVDEDIAKEIIDNKEWEKVEEMMFKAEELANEKGD